jgi:hypothetical protein
MSQKIPDAENVTMSGIFLSKVFDGPYKSVPKWIKIMENTFQKKVWP